MSQQVLENLVGAVLLGLAVWMLVSASLDMRMPKIEAARPPVPPAPLGPVASFPAGGDVVLRPADALNVPAGPAWVAMPGNRLELGATGYWIELDPDGSGWDFRLYGPEGHQVGRATAMHLHMLKTMGEHAAAERAQFAAVAAQSSQGGAGSA